MNHPEYRYQPWSEERRKRASDAAKARVGKVGADKVARAIMEARVKWGWTFGRSKDVMAIDLILAEAALSAMRPAVPPPPPSSVSDEAILDALVHGTYYKVKGKRRYFAPSLYVAASKENTRKADWNCWFVTGPGDRPGYVKGPFPLEQVQRLIESGRLQAEAVDEHGNIHSYSLRPNGRRPA